jgi:hypothetical protein
MYFHAIISKHERNVFIFLVVLSELPPTTSFALQGLLLSQLCIVTVKPEAYILFDWASQHNKQMDEIRNNKNTSCRNCNA